MIRAALLQALVAAAVLAGDPPFVRRPVPDLIREARAATPPPQAPKREPDLVDLATLDPAPRLDIRYATADNFLGAPVYGSPRAFLQRPAAEALARAARALRAKGFGLKVFDAYRPWWVTKVFWEATAPAQRAYVADPAKGSLHNRGCAVDLTLVRLADGTDAPMPSAYDDFSPRAHPDYPGGTEEERRNRGVLRAAMEAEGFTVNDEEWWHYDHASRPDYGVLNLPFEALVGPSPLVAKAGQVLLVTTEGWDGPRARLQRFERTAGGALAPVGPPLAAWVGHAGLAWRTDAGAPEPPAPGPRKREGDGRAPAGILGFGDFYGYAPTAPEGVRWPYRMATDQDRCVDDPDHADYNRLLRLAPGAKETWRSAEKLKLETEHYRQLLVIRYNDAAPVPKAGSCIFLHVAPPPGGGTAGCTALAQADLLTLLRWLDPARSPVLVQVPAPALGAARAAWSLPPELRPVP